MPTREEQEEQIWKFLRDMLDIHSQSALYIEAFTHSVDLNKEPLRKTNANLAYLGDFIVNASIGQYYFRAHPDWDMGTLSIKSNETRSDVKLSLVAEKLKMPIIGVNLPTEKEGIVTMHAKALEALFGAIYLDQGFEKARAITEKYLI